MKALLVLVLALSSSAFAADFSYKCSQRTDRSSIDRSVGKIGVTVTHVRNIGQATEYRGEYMDSIDVVKVVVTGTKNGKTKVLKTMTTISSSEDVMFMIQEKNIKFHLYLDELEEAGLETELNGTMFEVSLTCDFVE